MFTSTRLRLLVAAGSLALGLPVLVGSAGASSSLVAVGTGVTPAVVPGAVAFGSTPPSTPETVSFILDENNLGTLEQAVQAGATGDLSVAQFAAQYGQSAAHISELQNYLGSFGISTSVYADHVDVVATGTAGEFDAALSVSQTQYHSPAIAGVDGLRGSPAQTFHGTNANPELPQGIGNFVLAVLGLTNYAPYVSDAAQVSSALPTGAVSSSTCEEITGLPSACNLPSDFANRYGLSQLYRQGARGQGQTIGIVTLAALDPGAPQYFWSQVAGINQTGTVSVDNIDGGPGAPSLAAGSSETDLDVEQSGGVAPAANVVVYQAPNTDYGFADAFFSAASQDVAGSVSASWGESETILQASYNAGVEDPAYQQAFDEAFLELAAQGQASFASAGDEGAYTASADLGSTNLSVDSPADSPYITAAGGTTLPWSATFSDADGTANVNVTAERAWGWDYLWAPIATLNDATVAEVAPSLVVGGGGGISSSYPTPTYQQGVSGVDTYTGVENLTPIDYTEAYGLDLPTAWNVNTPAPIVHGYQSGRALPDLSTDADPYTGYLEYSPAFAQNGGATLEGGWGGTSFVAPQLNGATAVIDSLVGHRVGFWNPSIYRFAQGEGSPFTALQRVGSSNDNIFYTGEPGTLFNEATGLGTPDFATLARDFAGQ